MDFAEEILTKHGRLCTTEQALRFLENKLSAELKAQSRWTFARAADRSRTHQEAA